MGQNTVYLLTNTVNGKVYVGQTWAPLEVRWARGYKNCHKLMAAFRAYGKKVFAYTTLAQCYSQDDADEWEDYFVGRFDSIRSGYNIRAGGRGRFKHSEETKAKMSVKARGNKANLGRKFSEEHRAKLRESHLKRSELLKSLRDSAGEV